MPPTPSVAEERQRRGRRGGDQHPVNEVNLLLPSMPQRSVAEARPGESEATVELSRRLVEPKAMKEPLPERAKHGEATVE